MFRQHSSRNQRNKGFKVKHALQIALLLAVCVWLLYQVKHSHDKKKAYDASISKMSANSDGGDQVLNLGRKDLKDDMEVVSVDEKHGEEEGEEEEGRHEEVDDDGRRGGDDEIDEGDREKEEDSEHVDDFVDEERDNDDERDNEEENENEEVKENEEDKENGEKENEESKEDGIDELDSSENQDHGNGDGKSQEAHEENYIADNAANSVTQDTQTMRSHAGNGGSDNPNEELVVDSFEKMNKENEKSNVTEKNTVEPDNANQNVSDVNVGLGDGGTVDTPSNSTVDEEKVSGVNLSDKDVGSTEFRNETEPHKNPTLENVDTRGLELSNVDTRGLELSQDHNVTSEMELPNKENMETELLEHGEKTNTTSGVEESDENPVTLTSDEHVEDVQVETTDSSTALVTPEERDVLTDLETLPQAENDHNNEAVAEE